MAEQVDKLDWIVPLFEDTMWDNIMNDPYTLPSRDIQDWTLLLDEGTDEEFYIDANRPHFTIERCDVAYGGNGWYVKVWFTADSDVWDTTEYSDVCLEPQKALDNMFARIDLN